VLSTAISHYRILRKLGAGGMGEVYEAEDLRLGRHVALKFLPDAVASDPRSLERFEREARAASSIDHPNICTIYDVGEQDGRAYMAMQLLEGRDLRTHIGGHPLSLDEILDLGMQIADALDAAHSHGIIHRDIKPSNIWVTPRGQAKLLDFGLAKINPPGCTAPGSDSTGTTISRDVLSGPETVLGTLGYMSPEQALGKELDSRSDLFSFGAVLYEMATGVAPFFGSSTAAIFDSILNKQPVPVLRLNPSIPEELDHIIRKAIEKDRDVRSQSAPEIRADLKRLKRDTSSGRITAPIAGGAPAAKRRKWPLALFSATILVVAALAFRYFLPVPVPKVIASTQLTTGVSQNGLLATDGSRIYFSEFVGGHLVLVQVSVTGGDTLEIPTPFRNVMLAAISPDHSQLLVGDVESMPFDAAVWAVPIPSGSPRRLGDIKASFASWSPDMKQLVFTGGSNIYLASADGTAPRQLVTVDGKPQLARFSPDGTCIRFTLYDPNKLSSSLWEVGADGKNLHSLLPGWHNPPLECCGEWTPDGRYYVFLSGGMNASSDIFALRDDVGFLRRRSPAPIQLTAGPLVYNYVTPSTDGNKIFASATLPRVQLVRYDPNLKLFVPFMAGLAATDLSFSHDGQWVAYVSIPDGCLWRSRVDGTERLQLTYPPARAILPMWSPDNSRIVFQTFAAGGGYKAQWISSQGGLARDLLANGMGGVDFNFSPDGKSIIFARGPTYAPTVIFILDLKTRQVSNFPGSEELFSPRYSPDGRYLAALSQDSSTLFLYDFAAKKWNKWLTERGHVAYPTWSKDSKYIYFDNFMTDHPTARRIKVGDTLSEELFSLSGLRRYTANPAGSWGGLSPDGYRLYVEDTSVQEIYALQLQLP